MAVLGHETLGLLAPELRAPENKVREFILDTFGREENVKLVKSWVSVSFDKRVSYSYAYALQHTPSRHEEFDPERRKAVYYGTFRDWRVANISAAALFKDPFLRNAGSFRKWLSWVVENGDDAVQQWVTLRGITNDAVAPANRNRFTTNEFPMPPLSTSVEELPDAHNLVQMYRNGRVNDLSQLAEAELPLVDLLKAGLVGTLELPPTYTRERMKRDIEEANYTVRDFAHLPEGALEEMHSNGMFSNDDEASVQKVIEAANVRDDAQIAELIN